MTEAWGKPVELGQRLQVVLDEFETPQENRRASSPSATRRLWRRHQPARGSLEVDTFSPVRHRRRALFSPVGS
jgi:hypothetical protein